MTTPDGAAGGSQPLSGPQRPRRVWGSEIPYRNPHFTGREDEIQALRTQLGNIATGVSQPPGVLYGLGGG